jgi:flagellar motility protein MotE (MotC chaperone)
MKKLASFISVLCIINVLMLLGLGGYLWTTNRLNKPKVQTIADMIRHPGAPEGLRAKVYDIMTPATAPGTQTRPQTANPSPNRGGLTGLEPATAQERIDYLQKVLEEERLRLENESQKLRQQQDLLVQKQAQLDLDRKTLAEQKKAFEQSLAATTTQSDAAGFQKSLDLFAELKPKQVKDLLTPMSVDQIARYLAAMEPDRAAKIIAEFKSSEEKTLLNQVLDKVRGVASASGTRAASTLPAPTPVAAAPASIGP